MANDAYTFWQLAKDYWWLLKGQRLRFICFTSLKAFTDIIPFGTAYFLGKVVDFFADYQKGQGLHDFYLLVLLITIGEAFRVLIRFAAKSRMYDVAAKVRKEARVLAMRKLIDQELVWHEKEETGSKLHKITQGGDNLYYLVKVFSNDGLRIIIGILGAAVAFLSLQWVYGLYVILFSALYIFGECWFNRRISYWQDRRNKVMEKVSGKLHESASNLLTIKSLGLRQVMAAATSRYEQSHYKVWRKTLDISQFKSKTIKVYAAIGFGAFLLLIGKDVLQGVVTVGAILVYTSYFSRLRDALDTLSNEMGEFISQKSAVGRFMTILGAKSRERDSPDLPRMPSSWKMIQLAGATFSYQGKPVIQNVSLTIRRGEQVGLVGSSGSGKSTVAKLLLGLYEPQQGKILVDGNDLFGFRHSSVTKNIAIVLQDSEMFNLSLQDNIMISSGKRNQPLLRKALAIAHLQSVIQKLPQGIRTLIGERGYKVSGGERQRIGLARAIYKNASFLILDEATSHLDSRTEGSIQNSLEKELSGTTMLLIAHRLSTLRQVDRIIVLDEGRVVEEGSFEELLQKKGEFWILYHFQQRR